MRPSAATTSAARPGAPGFSLMAATASACTSGSGGAPDHVMLGAAMTDLGPGSMRTIGLGGSPSLRSGVIT